VKVFDLPTPQARIRLVETGVQKATISPSGRIMALPSTRSERVRSFVSLIRNALGGNPLGFDDLSNFYEIKLRDAATGRLVNTIDYPARRRPPDAMTAFP
jgi:hypothetical protein